MLQGALGLGAGGLYLLSGGLFSLPGSVCSSGSWELVSLHGAGAAGGAWLVSPALPSMLGVQAAPPGSQVRSRVCRRVSMVGAPFQDKTGLEASPSPVPGDLPHGHPGVHRPFTELPTQAAPSVFPAEASGGLPTAGRGAPTASGILSHVASPSLGALCPHCVFGGQGVTPGESGNQAQVALCWGVATGKGASPGPAWAQEGRRAAGAPAQLCTHRSGPPGPQTPQPTPVPVSENRRRQLWRPPGPGPWPAGPDGAGGSGARIRRLDPAAHRAWAQAHSGPAAQLQPAASQVPPGHNIPGRAPPVLSSPFPSLRDRRGARLHTAPAPAPRPAPLTLPYPLPARGVGATRGASGPGTCLPPGPKATWVQWSGHVERAHIHRPGPWGTYPGPGILPRRKQAGRPCRGRHVHRPCA